MMKIKIGITGQNGFLGKHLYNTIGLAPNDFEQVFFCSSYFNDKEHLIEFVKNCDVIVHLAAMNRHDNANVIYQTNINLVEKLIAALEISKSKAHVLFSSSSQEEKDNLYGKSKKEGRERLANWAANSGNRFTGIIMPNIFGPFGKPYYNSFVATFSHQLTHNEQPIVEVDSVVKLIYVGDLVKIIINEIRNAIDNPRLVIQATDEYRVSDISKLLENYKEQYFNLGIIPKLNNVFETNLFNTFRSYIDLKRYYPVKFIKHTDERGAFVEVIRLNSGGQVSFSSTAPGVTRGNHYHTRKIERFAVIKGKALVQLRKIGSDEILDFYLDGEEPSYIDMPIWYTHNIKNVGNEDLYTNFWINEFYNPADGDTYFEEV
jgi:UDP-2-acetamido-2,6-beta-L-arabino-hexul-4-ose reductase